MKKIVLSVVFTALVASSFAQFHFGVKGGLNKSTTLTESTINSATFSSLSKSGYNLGVFARLGVKKFYVQPEILFCHKLCGSSAGAVLQNLTLNTFQMPVLLGYKLIDLKLASLRVFTGPAMSVKASGNQVSNISSVSLDKLNNNTWDWQLGSGIDIGPLTFDIRYEWGLSKLSVPILTGSGFGNKANFVSLAVGFKFI
jgi:Outer membrane protein beta-barrel domain